MSISTRLFIYRNTLNMMQKKKYSKNYKRKEIQNFLSHTHWIHTVTH